LNDAQLSSARNAEADDASASLLRVFQEQEPVEVARELLEIAIPFPVHALAAPQFFRFGLAQQDEGGYFHFPKMSVFLDGFHRQPPTLSNVTRASDEVTAVSWPGRLLGFA
jgi:hypothetical protein